MELEESQQPDAVQLTPEPPAIEPQQFEQRTDVHQQFCATVSISQYIVE
jgi:hypothetical protein